MDDEWKEWDVVEAIRSTEIPGFMAPTGGDCTTEIETAFQSRGALNEWRESLPDRDTAVVVEFESDPPPPDE